MKVLVIGSGGREHVLCWCLARSAEIERLYCAPGNAGIAQQAECIALDVMGGDHAPDALLAGALEACSPLGTLHMKPERILLVGDEARIRAGLEEQGGNPGFAIQHASEVIGMEEKPGVALRAKRDVIYSNSSENLPCCQVLRNKKSLSSNILTSESPPPSFDPRSIRLKPLF